MVSAAFAAASNVSVAAGQAGSRHMDSALASASQSLPYHSLSAVACTGEAGCWAVGSVSNGAGTTRNEILQWHDGTWHTTTSPNPALGGDLNAVTCPVTGECWAVGQTGQTMQNGPLNETLEWNGKTWVLKLAPGQNQGCPSCSTSFNLNAVACSSAQACFATGTEGGEDEYYYQIQRWTRGHWAITTIPPDTSGGDATEGLNQFYGGKCLSNGDCWAVGNAGCGGDCSGGSNETYLWNGSKWSKVVAPSPGNTKRYGSGPTLRGVACPSMVECWAVGSSYSATGSDRNEILNWNGATWSLVQSPEPASGSAGLNGVTCVNASDCWAVGYSGGGPSDEILHWNGSTWSKVVAPSLNRMESLNGVACASARLCWAVGSYEHDKGHTANQILRWNGKHWTAADNASAS